MSSAACGSASIPLDIAADYTLRHTVEVEAADDVAACILSLETVLPPLPLLEPGSARRIDWTSDRTTFIGDILIVIDADTADVKGIYLWRGKLVSGDFIKMFALPASLSGRALH